MTALTVWIEYRGPVDSRGRREFTMYWADFDGVCRPEIAKDGAPVGYRRAQCFHDDPRMHIERARRRGVRVVEGKPAWAEVRK